MKSHTQSRPSLWDSKRASLKKLRSRPEGLDSQRTPESPRAKVRLSTVVVHEHVVITAIAEERTPMASDVWRRLDPARSLLIKLSQVLQLAVLIFRQNLDPHTPRQINSAFFWFVFLPRFKRGPVIACAGAALGSFSRTIKENIFSRCLVITDHVGFASSALHFMK